MKSITLLLPTIAGIVAFASAAALPNPQAAPAPAGAKIEELKSQFSSKNKRVRVTYGTFKLAAFNETKPMDMGNMGGMDMGGMDMGGMDMGDMDMGDMDMGNMDMGNMDMGNMGGGAGGGMDMPMGGMEDEGGMTDASNEDSLKPCSDCTLKYAKAFLKYPDGTEANINTGAWLHHLTMAAVAPGRSDLLCPGGTERIPKGMERMLAFHNDRNETFYGVTGSDEMGFYLSKEDKLDMELMLKNELNVAKEVVFSIEWEFVPGKPAGYGDVRGIWMDAAPCSAMMSDLRVPGDQTQFKLTGPAWTSTVDGQLLNTVGHMHDGGLEVQILSNNKPICTSKAVYDGKPEYIPTAEAVAQGAAKISHISSYTPCNAIGPIKKGDQLVLTADYDLNKYKPGLNKVGEKSDVMGIAMVFVKVDKRYDLVDNTAPKMPCV